MASRANAARLSQLCSPPYIKLNAYDAAAGILSHRPENTTPTSKTPRLSKDIYYMRHAVVWRATDACRCIVVSGKLVDTPAPPRELLACGSSFRMVG